MPPLCTTYNDKPKHGSAPTILTLFTLYFLAQLIIVTILYKNATKIPYQFRFISLFIQTWVLITFFLNFLAYGPAYYGGWTSPDDDSTLAFIWCWLYLIFKKTIAPVTCLFMYIGTDDRLECTVHSTSTSTQKTKVSSPL